jgi:hypothetical protein
MTVMNSTEECRKECTELISSCYAFTIEKQVVNESIAHIGCALHTVDEFRKAEKTPCESCITYVKETYYQKQTHPMTEYGAAFYYMEMGAGPVSKKNGTLECLRKCASLPSCVLVLVNSIRGPYVSCAFHNNDTYKKAASSPQPRCASCDQYVKRESEGLKQESHNQSNTNVTEEGKLSGRSIGILSDLSLNFSISSISELTSDHEFMRC